MTQLKQKRNIKNRKNFLKKVDIQSIKQCKLTKWIQSYQKNNILRVITPLPPRILVTISQLKDSKEKIRQCVLSKSLNFVLSYCYMVTWYLILIPWIKIKDKCSVKTASSKG